jgi:hypothetical protein
MSVSNYYEKYLKYKNKYLQLKNLAGRGLPAGQDQYDYPLSHYFIASSHNTYLSGHQLWGNSDLGCYTHFIRMFKGGCVEIDPVGIVKREDKTGKGIEVKDPSGNSIYYDVEVSHTHTATGKIYLFDILTEINNEINEINKIGQGMLGPVILSFDNKDIKGGDDIAYDGHDIVWDIIFNTVGEKLYPIEDDDIGQVLLSKVKGKVLLKWPQCDKDTDKISKKGCEKDNRLRKPVRDNSIRRSSKDIDTISIGSTGSNNSIESFYNHGEKWTHFNKSNIESHSANHNYFYPNKNSIDEENEKFVKTIAETHTKFIRTYPSGLAIDSSNYPIMARLLNGIQMIALNMQTLDPHTLLLREIFKNGCMRLKPLWMRSLTPLQLKLFKTDKLGIPASMVITEIIKEFNKKLKTFTFSINHPDIKFQENSLFIYHNDNDIKKKEKSVLGNIYKTLTRKRPVEISLVKNITVENVHTDFPIFYIECIINDGNYDYRQFYGTFEISPNQIIENKIEIEILLHQFRSDSKALTAEQQKIGMTCDYPLEFKPIGTLPPGGIIPNNITINNVVVPSNAKRIKITGTIS